MSNKPLYVRPFSVNPANHQEILDGSGRCIASSSIGAARALVRHLNDPTPAHVNAPAAAVGDWRAAWKAWLADMAHKHKAGEISDYQMAVNSMDGFKAGAAWAALAVVPAVPVQGVTAEERGTMDDMQRVIEDGDAFGSAAKHRTTIHVRQGLEKLLAIISRLTTQQ